ncbi:MAG: alpha/beta fold hydrolase [Alphaproteobacteria bacterium]|nr:alpha/beta fold hydrolase [Alphaproteobacteria bacterium]
MGRRSYTFLLLAVIALTACAPRLQSLGPDASQSMTPQLTADTITTRDGIALPVRSWLPEGAPQAVIIALHGFNDYGNAFADIGAFMADQDVAVLAYDQRGFGAAPQPGIWPGRKKLTADFRDVLAAVRTAYPGVPVHAMGESMGGGVLMAAWAETPYPIDSIILVAPAVWGRASMPFYQTAALFMSAYTTPWLRVTGGGLKRQPSDNIEMLRALGRDPLVIKETRVDAVWGITNLMDAALVGAKKFDAPALILYGANDDIIPANATLDMLESLPPPQRPRKVAIYDAGFHMLLRDLKAETAWRDILAWLDDPAGGLPSGADTRDPLNVLATR